MISRCFDQLGMFLKVATDFNNLVKCQFEREEVDDTEKEHTAARRCTSFGHVAGNMSVWRSGRICGSKPVSSSSLPWSDGWVSAGVQTVVLRVRRRWLEGQMDCGRVDGM
jgi:hypothetical protein